MGGCIEFMGGIMGGCDGNIGDGIEGIEEKGEGGMKGGMLGN